jgi:hypothetical protein
VIVDGLAPGFGSTRNLSNALKLVIYSSTAYWVSGILLVVPALWPLNMLFSLYGLYLFYLGLPILMKTPKEKITLYFVMLLVSGLIITALTAFITTLIFPEGRMGAA